MSVTTEDVEEGVKQLWTAASLTPSLILNRVNETASAPYTSLAVTEEGGEIVRVGSGGYLQTFTVELKTWDEAGATDAGTLKAAIEAAFYIQTRRTLTLTSGRTLQLLHGVKVSGGLTEDDATQQGQAVKIATDRFEFLCQG